MTKPNCVVTCNSIRYIYTGMMHKTHTHTHTSRLFFIFYFLSHSAHFVLVVNPIKVLNTVVANPACDLLNKGKYNKKGEVWQRTSPPPPKQKTPLLGRGKKNTRRALYKKRTEKMPRNIREMGLHRCSVSTFHLVLLLVLCITSLKKKL